MERTSRNLSKVAFCDCFGGLGKVLLGRRCRYIMEKYLCILLVWASLDISCECFGWWALSLNHAKIRVYPIGLGLIGHILGASCLAAFVPNH